LNHKVAGDLLNSVINKLISVKHPKQNKGLLLVLSDLLAGSNRDKSLDILRSLHEAHS
jgi:signal recognition particle subunit SRP72